MDRPTIGQDEALFPARLVADRLRAVPLRDLCHFTAPRDAETSTIRLAQFYALIRLVPVAVMVNLLAVFAVSLSFFGSIPTWQFVGWPGTMIVLWRKPLDSRAPPDP